ncbi:MAG: LptF/LptG family permease [Alphaproteobacteria bacterium]|nr:LptF/LptG family permease [Alphaproteobacteria bacterium]
MAKIDRYILSQLMGPFAIFSLILIGIYWVARAIGLFDTLIGDGQSIGVFVGIITLFLPQVVAIVLPVVSFAAAIYVSNRLHSESEMVIFQAAGFTPYRLARPFLVFGLLVATLASALSHYLVPASIARLEQRQREVSQDVATRLIVGGKFVHPSQDVTFFVRKVSKDGSLVDIFLFDQRPDQRDITYTAHKAVLLKSDDNARLVMFDGLIQTFDAKNLLLTKIQFDQFVFDIGSLATGSDARPPKIRDYSTLASLFPTPKMLKDTSASAAQFRLQAFLRLEQPLQSLVYPLIAMAVLMLGNFSRFGVFRQIMGAIALVVTLSILAVPLRDVAANRSGLQWVVFIPDILGLLAVYVMLRRSAGRKTARARDIGLAVGAAT